MILAIDIGGTKTLLAVFDKTKKPLLEQKFETPTNYNDFKKQLEQNIKGLKQTFSVIVVAAPGKIDRTNGVGLLFGNLPWKNVPLRSDIQKTQPNCKVFIENDANLAGLSESLRIKPQPHKALYITISTGIGTGIVTDGTLDPDFLDSEGGSMLFEHNGKLQQWEKFASGKAIVAKYGKRASDIDDSKIWKQIAKDFAVGIVDLSAVLDPDVIIIGGGVGTHFNKYGVFLKEYIKQLTPPVATVPKIVPAQAAEEAVIYGCVEYAIQNANN
jgi:predicted NBD/HSP70 family sugar kinase